jgi:hypothetical protein
MAVKTMETVQQRAIERDGRHVFSFMNLVAWITLGVGVMMTLWGLGDFSDTNLTLMLGIGFMVGSVFIYTIGTATHLVHKRHEE